MKTSEVLNRAADLIEERGWQSGPRGMRVDGPHCVLGAVSAVCGAPVFHDVYCYPAPLSVHRPPAEALATYLGLGRSLDCVDVAIWNDGHESAQPVVEALRAAAVIEAAKETRATAETTRAFANRQTSPQAREALLALADAQAVS